MVLIVNFFNNIGPNPYPITSSSSSNNSAPKLYYYGTPSGANKHLTIEEQKEKFTRELVEGRERLANSYKFENQKRAANTYGVIIPANPKPRRRGGI